MIIRLLNPITALYRHKAQVNKSSKPVLTYQDKIKSDRVATGAIVLIILIFAFVYNILYSM